MTPPSQTTTRSRQLGSLYGLAVGDALGGPYEGKDRGSYEVTFEMEPSDHFQRDGGPLPPGSWSDDTSMALCIAASLVEKKDLVWTDVADKFVRWNTEGASADGVRPLRRLAKADL